MHKSYITQTSDTSIEESTNISIKISNQSMFRFFYISLANWANSTLDTVIDELITIIQQIKTSYSQPAFVVVSPTYRNAELTLKQQKFVRIHNNQYIKML
jgi:hypothetical protein